VPDPTRSLRDGAVAVWGEALAKDSGWTTNIVKALAKAFKIDLDKPWNKLSDKQRDVLLNGTGDKRVTVSWEGRHSTGEWAMSRARCATARGCAPSRARCSSPSGRSSRSPA
jgi:excinuclease ABC subunit A